MSYLQAIIDYDFAYSVSFCCVKGNIKSIFDEDYNFVKNDHYSSAIIFFEILKAALLILMLLLWLLYVVNY